MDTKLGRRWIGALVMFCGFCLTASPGLSAGQDARGGKDHPLLTRMPNYYLNTYDESDFDQYRFKTGRDQEVTVEGHRYKISYYIKDGVEDIPSELQILRNYANAVQKIGGTVVYDDRSRNIHLKVEKEGLETWIHVFAYSQGSAYDLVIVEKKVMAQDVVADAASLGRAIGATGKAAIYGIYFDFNKADIKAESEPALREIAKLLSQTPQLKLYVVGHTDNVGGLDYNLKLSQARAEAVVKALVVQHQIDASRLKPSGVGPLAPVASNKTEDGRAKNRRVELVEQ